jgi:hypothetical protein
VTRGYNESCAYNRINLIDSQYIALSFFDKLVPCSFSVVIFFIDDNFISNETIQKYSKLKFCLHHLRFFPNFTRSTLILFKKKMVIYNVIGRRIGCQLRRSSLEIRMREVLQYTLLNQLQNLSMK